MNFLKVIIKIVQGVSCKFFICYACAFQTIGQITLRVCINAQYSCLITSQISQI